MKKIIITAAVLCGIMLFNNNLNAQASIGVKGGINFANVSNFGNDTRIGGNIGFFAHAQLNRNWCIQPELLYSSEGSRFMTTNGERTLALNYIQVPVMFQYFPVKQFYVEAGPQAGLLTNADVKSSNYGNKYSVSDGYKKGDVDLNVGAGIHATPNLGFFARYSFGLTNISTDPSQTFRNNVGQVGAFYLFARY
jgi:hypothetical protein